MLTGAFRSRIAIDLARTLGPLRVGRHDPTILLGADTVLRAMRTPDGPATLRAEHTAIASTSRPGDPAPTGPSTGPRPPRLPRRPRRRFDPDHPAMERAVHQPPDGLRLPRTGLVVEALVPAVLGQRVTGFEASRSFRQLVERWGEPAPGPGGLTLLPDVAVIAELGYYDLHVIGLERTPGRHAGPGRRPGRAPRSRRSTAAARPCGTRLEAIPGVGAWTSAEVARLALGDADAVSVGDYHLKHLVSWALAGEPRGTDERMLELLEPFAGHRGRACVLHRGRRPPRPPPRAAPPDRADRAAGSGSSVTP